MTTQTDIDGASGRAERVASRVNPFVGPRALAEGQPLFGRDREMRELRQLITSERIVLLYSPSGAGKTSLLEAGLRPEMRRQHFDPLPTVRVNVAPSGAGNRYAASMLRCLGGPSAATAGSLDDAVRALSPDETRNPLLVFDQFEELLNTDWTDNEGKTAFMRELGVVLRDRSRFAVIAMREDYIAQLDPYLGLVPTRLAVRYRLDLLRHDAACAVAVQTAASSGLTMDPPVANAIVTELRRVRAGRGHDAPGASAPEFRLGPYVEPVHLQVVCKQLIDRLPADRDVIAESAGVGSVDVDASLAAFYDHVIAGVPGATEREAREWCETVLVTRDRIRAQTLDGPGDGDDALRYLEERHLVRADERQGTTWYELAHDRLVEPILQSNESFRRNHLTTLERTAPLWDSQHRPTSLLLSGRDLRAARRLAGSHQRTVLPAERDLLRASAHRQWMRRVAVTLPAVLIVGLLAALVGRVATTAQDRTRRANDRADEQTRRAELASRKAESQRLATESARVSASDPELGALLAVESARSDADAAKEALVAASYNLDGRPLFGHGSDVNTVAFSIDGARLASASSDGTVRLWDTARREPAGVLVVRGGGVLSMALSPDGRTIAAGSKDGTVRLFDVSAGTETAAFTAGLEAVTSLAFGRDGVTLVMAGGAKGRVQVWDVARRQRRLDFAASEGTVYALAVAPDGLIATGGGADWSVHLWRGDTGDALGQLDGHTDSVNGLAFANDGAVLASVSADDTGRTWDVTSGRPLTRLVGHSDDAYAVASADGVLATADFGGTIRTWDPQRGVERRAPLLTRDGPVRGLAVAGDGCLLASAGGGATVHLWNACYERWSSDKLVDALHRRVSRDLTPAEVATYRLTEPRPPSVSTTTSPVASSSTVVATVPASTQPPSTVGTAPSTTQAPPTTATSAAPTSTTVAPAVGPAESIERRLLGASVRGTPITAVHRGQSTGNTVVVIGVIHGNRPAGLSLTQALRASPLPAGTDLWIIDTMNPDGLADGTRTNSRGVDLNRNFETTDWRSVGATTDTWTGPSAGSEPETRALQSFLIEVRPQLVVWWDQFRDSLVDSSEAATPDVVQRYAEVAQLPVQPANCRSPSCVGNLSTFVHERTGASAFVVSLPGELNTETHVAALFAAARR